MYHAIKRVWLMVAAVYCAAGYEMRFEIIKIQCNTENAQCNTEVILIALGYRAMWLLGSKQPSVF